MKSPRIDIPSAERSITEQNLLNPDIPLPENVKVLPIGTYPISAGTWWLFASAVMILLAVVQIVDDLNGKDLGVSGPGAGLIGIALMIFGMRARTRGKEHKDLVKEQRWRKGVFILQDRLMIYDGQRLSILPRKCIIGARYMDGRSREGASAFVLRYKECDTEYEFFVSSESQSEWFATIEEWLRR